MTELRNEVLERAIANGNENKEIEPRLIRAYEKSKYLKHNYIDLYDGICRIEDFERLKKNLEDCGIEELTISDTSCWLMEFLDDMQKIGYKVDRMIKISTGDRDYDEEKEEIFMKEKNAIVIRRF